MAGMTRRIRMPARAPIANAASVQVAKAIPRRSKMVGYSGPFSSPAPQSGWTYQETSTLMAPAATATATASGAILATDHRDRPKPWVQA